MKKVVLAVSITMVLVSCGGFSEEQGKAAQELCDCIDADPYGNYDINYFECNTQLQEKYGTETFEEGSWAEALEENCTTVSEKIEEM